MGCRAVSGGALLFARLTLNYARYYGQDVAYGQSSAIALGNPAFVAGVLAVSAIANASARSRAAAQATPQWREWQTTTVYVTSQRLAVHASGRWLSFEYRAITAVYPEVASATLVCQFDSTEPLLLSGDEAAIAAVLAVTQTHGLEALRDPSRASASRPPARGTRAPSRRRVETNLILSELTSPPAKNSASFVPAG